MKPSYFAILLPCLALTACSNREKIDGSTEFGQLVQQASTLVGSPQVPCNQVISSTEMTFLNSDFHPKKLACFSFSSNDAVNAFQNTFKEKFLAPNGTDWELVNGNFMAIVKGRSEVDAAAIYTRHATQALVLFKH